MITINGQVVESKDKVTIGRKFSEDHDNGKITVINTRSTRYEMYSPVDYTNGAVSEQMLVESDNVVQLNATDYEHTITLVENKAKFDGLYPADRSFTKLNQTLDEILTVYQREFTTYHNITIAWSLTTAQEDEVITFKEFSGVNFTTILVGLFRKINAIPYVLRSGNTWTIYARPYNERGSLISGDSTTKTFIQSNLDYATKVKSQLKNAVNERAQVDVEWFPSENGYVLPKSPKPIKATSDLEYQLPSPIVKILEVIAVDVPYSYIYTNPDPIENPDGNPETLYANATVDITSQVVERQVYETLLPTDATAQGTINATSNQKNNIFYNLFDTKIEQLFESSTDKRWFINFDTYYLLNAIAYVIKNAIEDADNIFGELIESDGITDVETEDIKLRFKYVKQRNIDLVANRNTKGEMNTTTTIHNQRDSNVEISQYKKALKNYSNRLGNDHYTKTKNFPTGATPHDIGDFLADGKVVVEVRNTYHNNFTFCEWVEVKNFANLESEYAISKRPEPFEITNKTVQTNLVSEEYVFFSERNIGVDTRLTTFAQEGLLGLFALTSVTDFEKVHSAVFKPVLTGWDSTKAISMELDNDGDGNLLTFHAFFEHQSLAGNIYYDIDTDTYVDYYQPLKYTDDSGELTNFKFYLVPDVDYEDGGEYPLIITETPYTTNKLTDNTISEPIDLDINAAFAITYNISFVGDENIYVGEFLARNNYLISDQQDTHTIVMYKSSKPYTLYDQEPRATDTVASITYDYDFDNRKITFNAGEDVDYFCFTKNGHILLAMNKSLSSGDTYVVYMNILKTLEDFKVYTISAIADDLSTLTATALLEYTSRTYPISASASDLATLNGSGVLAYTNIQYELTINATSIASLTGTVSLDYSGVVYSISANATDIANISGSGVLSYTDRNYLLEATGTSIAGLSGTADLAYVSQNYSLSATGTSIADLTGNCDISYTYLDWSYIGTSAPPEDDTVDLGTSGTTSCRTSSAAKEDLIQAGFPASDYATLSIMRVDHSYEDPVFGTSPCTPYYYRAVEVTV
jgi:hypothetical protein